MQIVIGMGMLDEILKTKDIGKSKITIMCHEDDMMTVNEHLAIEKMKVKPEFTLSEFDDTEIGWSMTAGALLEKYSECVLVTDIESLLKNPKVETRDGKKVLYFAGGLQEALKTAAANEKKPAKRAKAAPKPAEKKTASAVKKEPAKAEKKENSQDEDVSALVMDEPEFAVPEPEAPKHHENTGYTHDDFREDLTKYGVYSEAESEAIHNALLDAKKADDLPLLLKGRVGSPYDLAEEMRPDFSYLKKKAQEAEKNSLM